jgi:hypothetical protein
MRYRLQFTIGAVSFYFHPLADLTVFDVFSYISSKVWLLIASLEKILRSSCAEMSS